MTAPVVPIHPEGGSAVPVHAVSGPSIGGPAIPVYVVNDGRPTLGQPPRRVKVITDADLTINGGNYWIEGRPAAMPVAVSNATSGDEGNVAIPVYSVNAWPGSSGTTTISKANGGGPYAAGIYVTGNGSRILTFPRGTQIAGNFYANFDSNQGSICMWITPDWAGNDGKKHVLLQWSANGSLYKDTDNKLYLSVASGVSMSVDISAWAAASTKRLDIRWDADNPIDGAGNDRLCISINDTHTFGVTSDYTPEAPAETIYIGTDSTGAFTAGAKMEGITISREVWWDGTNGVDLDFALDTVAMDYAKTRGYFPDAADGVFSIGSWGLVASVPTDNTPGTIAAGTVTLQAYTHPHVNNLLAGTNGKNGFMFDGTYTNDGLALNGAPTVAAVAEANKVFAGGYSVQHTGASQWIEWTLASLTAGARYAIRAIAHSDGTSVPSLVVYDVTNTAAIATLNGATTSTRVRPNVLMFSFELPTVARGAAADCVSIKIQLKNTNAASTVYWHQVELMTNLIDNPSVAYGAGDPFIPTGWEVYNPFSVDMTGDVVLDTSATARTGHALSLITIEDHAGVAYTANAAASVGAFYCFGGWLMKATEDATVLLYFRENTGRYTCDMNSTAETEPTVVSGVSSAGAWKHNSIVMHRINADALAWLFMFFGGSTLAEGFGDDFYCFPLNAVNLTAT